MSEITTSYEMVVPESQIAAIFGQQDKHARQIKKALNIAISYNGSVLTLSGEQFAVGKGVEVITHLLEILKEKSVNGDDVHSAIFFAINDEIADASDILKYKIKVAGSVKCIVPKSKIQQKYLAEVVDKDMVFAFGPAGTGKTFLAVAMAVNYYLEKKVNRIILTRPAVEAGEKLGFLPGDLADKINPYLRPLYDALYSMMDYELVSKLMEKSIIEVAPLAFMRGRTLTDSFVILDEAQNTTPSQMKMFLTRLGFGSKAIITGDVTQIDLPKEQGSGLADAISKLKNIVDIGFIELTDRDVVRHPLVTKIINAYADKI